MDRLTRKENVDYTTNATIHTVGFVVKGDRNRDYNNALKKLYELENLEEELGCSLKARTRAVPGSSIYDKNGDEYLIEFIEKQFFVVNAPIYMSFKWKDYKKTWWLREDKSE